MFGKIWCMWLFVRWFLEWPFHDISGWLFWILTMFVWRLFRKLRRFGWSYGWYYHVKGVNIFHLVRFDIIKFHFNCCFNFQFGWFIFLLNLFLALILSSSYSKDVVSVEIYLSWSTIFDENLVVVSFISFVYSERHSVSDLILTISFTIFFYY